jgi:uncharacterized membrane protein YphA (DoxX/SURF4 family)
MDEVRKNKAVYWISTILFVLPLTFSAILYLRGAPMMVQAMHSLGYPSYLLTILGVAKLLGAAAILTGRSELLKEWAYAGFTFDLLGAAISHVSSGQALESGAPLVIWLVMLVSYRSWKKMLSLEAVSEVGSLQGAIAN